MPAMWPAHGPAGRSAHDRHQCQRHPRRARWRPASTSCARSRRRCRRRWTSRWHRISSASCSTRTTASRAPVRALMASLAQSRRFVCPPTRWRAARRSSRPTAPTRRRPRRDPHHAARERTLARSAYRGCDGGRREGEPRSVGADGGAVTAHAAKFPDAVEAACGSAAAARMAVGLGEKTERCHHAAGRPGRRRSPYPLPSRAAREGAAA